MRNKHTSNHEPQRPDEIFHGAIQFATKHTIKAASQEHGEEKETEDQGPVPTRTVSNDLERIAYSNCYSHPSRPPIFLRDQRDSGHNKEAYQEDYIARRILTLSNECPE